MQVLEIFCEGCEMRRLRRCCPRIGTLPASLGSWVVVSVCCALSLMWAQGAKASVALLLEQPYGKLNLVNPAGHSAIYLDHVCAETPVLLRPCRAGEMGVVISRYDGIDGYDWVAMPLIPYLYAVKSVEEIPERIDRAQEERLREMYRVNYLQSVAPTQADGRAPGGNWYELLGSAFDRTIYGFRVKTTANQDAELIAQFNDSRNVESYNGVYRNCADFARVTINRFYPHAIRRNYISELGITSPKSVARSLSHYAAKHPETGFEVFVIPQVKGDLPRSHLNTGVAEGILKRYSLPLVVVSPVSTAVVLAAYVGHGRFAMPRHAPLLAMTDEVDSDAFATIRRPFPETLPSLPAPAARVVLAQANTVQPTEPMNGVALLRVRLNR
jgi:hypothetical protein